MERFNRILCVVTTPQLGKVALDRAVTLAENNQAGLTAVAVARHVSVGMGMPDGGPISADLQAAMVSDCAQKLELAVAPYLSRVEIKTKVLVGVQFTEIIREVLRNQHDLLVKASESLEWMDQLFGSEDMHLLRKCPCPVWLIKPSMPRKYRSILAAVDVNDMYPEMELNSRCLLNQHIVELATSMALADFSELHIVHAWEAVGESELRGSFMRMPEEKVTAYVENIRRKLEANLESLMLKVTGDLGQEALDYLKPRVHMVKGWERKVIPALAKEVEADLVVMGTVSRTGVPGLIMGNTAESILNQLECSVLAIKPVDFVSPVKFGEFDSKKVNQ
jgi:nucleotide-binding universal stress UspA family protein